MSYWEQLVVLASINVLLAFAAFVPMTAGLMLLSFGSYCGAGALVAAYLHGMGLPFTAAVGAGALAGALVSGLVEMLCHRQSGFLLAVSTLALTELAHVLVTNSELLGGALGFKHVELHSSTMLPVFCVISSSLFMFWLERTKVRDVVNLVGDDPMLAESLGIRLGHYRIGVTLVSGAFCGCAGALLIHAVGILDPRVFGVDFGLQVLTFAILGGRRWWGPPIAAVLLTVVPESLRFSFEYRMILYGVLLVWSLSRLPGGLSAVRLPGWAKLARPIQ